MNKVQKIEKPKSVFGLGFGLSSVEAWFSATPDIEEEVLSGVGGDQFHGR